MYHGQYVYGRCNKPRFSLYVFLLAETQTSFKKNTSKHT